jgi:hypothetical protein
VRGRPFLVLAKTLNKTLEKKKKKKKKSLIPFHNILFIKSDDTFIKSEEFLITSVLENRNARGGRSNKSADLVTETRD